MPSGVTTNHLNQAYSQNLVQGCTERQDVLKIDFLLERLTMAFEPGVTPLRQTRTLAAPVPGAAFFCFMRASVYTLVNHYCSKRAASREPKGSHDPRAKI
ncbi:hypothetical protein A3A35_01800 [Candidatus Kaiserbacteria bacterium RIFCSPLOWO2_01_FULL_51_21]|uniref:Uncharacterized protein n=1 Tax=Candidatus Kaiserbacteria bacterium RIFCSPLOWO2_01_FULL_51_21 TaxID=1798508 RepID=A0A1F6ECT6_9BACT|nr:MAG: hypothetical protein A3A35_01800 [Candidatus Kaiserbacteria bacterium RIFCSPLOWO2_01_FULL_51_21]